MRAGWLATLRSECFFGVFIFFFFYFYSSALKQSVFIRQASNFPQLALAAHKAKWRGRERLFILSAVDSCVCCTDLSLEINEVMTLCCAAAAGFPLRVCCLTLTFCASLCCTHCSCSRSCAFPPTRRSRVHHSTGLLGWPSSEQVMGVCGW